MPESSKRGKAGVLALDHVAFGVHSIAEVSPILCVQLGAVPFQSGPGIGFNGAQWTLPGGGRVEAIEPDGGSDGFLHRFLAVRGPRIHHVTFKVDDIHAGADAVRAAGLTVVGLHDGLASWKEMFLHPKEAQGIVVQLAESHPEIGDDGWTSAWPYPRPEPPASSPRVLGLRLRARSAERALTQWRDLLGADAEQHDGRIRFHWPGSPLWLAVEIRPEAVEGPIALEVLAPGAGRRRSERIDEIDVSVIAVDR
jgi:methylmalonyl-CoA/ethylmalonyl-CoA epimerase